MVQFNWLLLTFLTLFLLRSVVQGFLHGMNLSFLRRYGTIVPEVFQDTLDHEKLKKISTYTIDSEKFHLWSTFIGEGILLAILLSGFLPWLVKIIHQYPFHLIIQGLIFFALLSILTHLIHIPFDFYETFVIEEHHGFNVMNLKLWILDLGKGMVITAILGGLLLGLLLWLVIDGGEGWWVWAWVGVGGFELLFLWLFPVIILPLFNKFTPIENKELESHIRRLMERVGLRTRGVFKMDASKRSKHTNAFFVGLGRTKRIVLFDTLLNFHPEEEILSILAHEAGHWKRRHVLWILLPLEIFSFFSFYFVAKLLKWPLLYQTFGFQESFVYVGLFLIGIFFSLISFFAQPLESAIQRKFEKEADDFALELIGRPEPLILGLKRLAMHNLANLHPHPLYAWFYYSHPPFIDRITRLNQRRKTKA